MNQQKIQKLNTCCTLAVIVCLCVIVKPGLAQAPARLLPLREADLLTALRTRPEPPILTDVSVSPDGAWGLYQETTRKAPYDDHDDRVVTRRVWLVDLGRGRRVLLGSDSAAGGAARLTPVPDLHPQWAADGRRVAWLEQLAADRAVVLTVWRTDRPHAPVRTALPRLRLVQDSALRIQQWAWFPERDEVWLEVRVKDPWDAVFERRRTSGGTASSGPAAPAAWAWLWTDATSPKRVPAEDVPTEDVRGLVVRWVVVSLAHQTARELPPDSALGRPYSEGGRWTLTRDRRHVLYSTEDPRYFSGEGAFRLWAHHTGDPRGRGWQGLRSAVVALDARHARTHALYTGGPGRKGHVVELPGTAGYALIEETPETSVWPIESVYGQLRVVTAAGARRDVPGVPILLGSRLFAGPAPNRVLLWEGNYERSDRASIVDEVDLGTGRHHTLTPPGRSATAVDVAADGRTIVAVLESVDTPPELHVWTVATRQWRALTHYGKLRVHSGEGTAEWYTWRSRDSLWDVTGILFKPPHFDPGQRYPLLVCLNGGHAGGTVANLNGYDPMVQGGCGVPAHILAAAGYLVLLPNHRQVEDIGYAANRAVLGRYGDQISLDVEAGVDRLIAVGWADSTRLGVLGHSHGSDEVAYTIAHTQRYKAAWINDGPLALWDIVLPAMMEARAQEEELYPSSYGREALTRLIGYDPVQRPWVDPFAIRTPLMIRWAGLQHDTLPFTKQAMFNPIGTHETFQMIPQTLKLLYALTSNRVPIEVLIDRDGHGVETPKYRLEYQSRVLQWFDYFVLEKGEDPIPAMRSPLDYTEELRAGRGAVP